MFKFDSTGAAIILNANMELINRKTTETTNTKLHHNMYFNTSPLLQNLHKYILI